MAIYDICREHESTPFLSIDHDGQKTWAFSSEEERKQYCPDERKAEIEMLVDIWYFSLNPRKATIRGLTIRQREA